MKFNKALLPFILVVAVVSAILDHVLSSVLTISSWPIDFLSAFVAVLAALPLLKRSK